MKMRKMIRTIMIIVVVFIVILVIAHVLKMFMYESLYNGFSEGNQDIRKRKSFAEIMRDRGYQDTVLSVFSDLGLLLRTKTWKDHVASS